MFFLPAYSMPKSLTTNANTRGCYLYFYNPGVINALNQFTALNLWESYVWARIPAWGRIYIRANFYIYLAAKFYSIKIIFILYFSRDVC